MESVRDTRKWHSSTECARLQNVTGVIHGARVGTRPLMPSFPQKLHAARRQPAALGVSTEVCPTPLGTTALEGSTARARGLIPKPTLQGLCRGKAPLSTLLHYPHSSHAQRTPLTEGGQVKGAREARGHPDPLIYLGDQSTLTLVA